MMKNNKKGQAAMEFLMTYGWAILVVLAAIGALAYFGVLSPDRFLPDKCTANPPFSCSEFKIDGTADTVMISLQANGGQDLTDVTVELSCDGFASPAADGVMTVTPATSIGAGNSWLNGAAVQFDLDAAALGNDATDAGCDDAAAADLAVGDRFKADYRITYTRSGENANHTTTGSITARVE